MDEILGVVIALMIGVALGIAVAVAPDGIVCVGGEGSDIMTVNYKSTVYRLVKLEASK